MLCAIMCHDYEIGPVESKIVVAVQIPIEVIQLSLRNSHGSLPSLTKVLPEIYYCTTLPLEK